MKILSVILNELDKRQSKNSNYSLRAFSRDLDVSHGYLIQLLSGKKAFTLLTAEKIINKLQIDDHLKELILTDLKAEDELKEKLKKLFNSKLKSEIDSILIPAENYLNISHWKYDAIFHLINEDDYQIEVKKIAKNLSLTREEAIYYIQKLEEANVIQIVNNKIKKTCSSYSMKGGATEMTMENLVNSFSLSQKELFNIGMNHFLTNRDEPNLFTTQAYKIPSEQIEIVKKAILQFSDTLEKILQLAEEDSLNEENIFFFNTQLFPISYKKD